MVHSVGSVKSEDNERVIEIINTPRKVSPCEEEAHESEELTGEEMENENLQEGEEESNECVIS